jgi:hypothetical protein
MRTLKRAAILPILALVAAAPALADVTYSTGDYKGTTSQKNGHRKFRKITFHADSVAGEITKMKFVESGTCSDGGPSSGSQKNLHTTVDANGKFVIDAVSKSGATKLHLTGAISGKRAHGQFVLKSRFNSHTNKPDKNGSVKCSTGKVTWSASFVG